MYQRWVFQFLLFVSLLCVFVPFAPKMPAATLDASWALSLNEAVARHLNFGKDILFTLGPYSSIYTKAYHPATDNLMLWGSIYLALSYWFCLWHFKPKKSWAWISCFCFFLLSMLYSRDSLLLSYPFLAGIAAITQKPRYLALLFVPFGLLVLIKGTFLVLCLSISFLCSVYLRKISCLIAPFLSTLFFWHLAGQQLFYLKDYFLKSIWFVADFTEAMSLEGPVSEVYVYLISGFLILATLFWQKKIQGSQRNALIILFALFLFISLKVGFVRHLGHSYVPASSIVLSALFLLLIIPEKKVILSLVSALFTCVFIVQHQQSISINYNVFTTLTSSWYGAKKRFTESSWAQQNYELALAYLHQQKKLPLLIGSSDIYSYQQAYLIASPNQWHPRPIFQSYSVFNARFNEYNKEHLQKKHSPQNIFFQIAAIDNKLPALEDGASWPWLIKNYHYQQTIHDFLLFQKSDTLGHQKSTAWQSLAPQLLGETVHLKSPLIFTKITVKPTLWGRLLAVLFKPSALEIILELKQGGKKHYRFVASMANAGFFLSPLIETTEEFALFSQSTEALPQKEVVAFTIKGNPLHWQRHYDIQIQKQPF